VILLETARVTGLDREMSTAMDPWRRQGAGYDPGKVVLDLAVALAVGGDFLADVAVLCGEPRVGVHQAPWGWKSRAGGLRLDRVADGHRPGR